MSEEVKYIKNASLKKLVKDVDEDIRIGAEALEELRLVFEESLRQHISKIIGLTVHAGRKTINVEDIQAHLDTV